MRDLDIGVIYTYEDHFMAPLLGSLVDSADGLSTRLILVDNASERGTGKWASVFPDTRLLRTTIPAQN